jgi:bis(5'-nucleosidyl)-tetraphosphatase
MPVERSAGAIIFRKESERPLFLLLHYPSRRAKRGARRDETKFRRTSGSRTKKEYWDLPKGHIEKGEKPKDTVKREVKEETGLQDIEFLEGFKETIKYFFKWENKNILKFVTFYLAETKTKEIKISGEHIGYEWLPYEEAMERLTFQNAKEILKRANNYLTEYKK